MFLGDVVPFDDEPPLVFCAHGYIDDQAQMFGQLYCCLPHSSRSRVDQRRLASTKLGHLDKRVVCSVVDYRDCCCFFEEHGAGGFGRDSIVGSGPGCEGTHIHGAHAITGLELGCLATCLENNASGFLT